MQWRERAAIADLARLIAVTRPGYAVGGAAGVHRRATATSPYDFTSEVTALAISSSDLRRRVAAGKSIRYLTMQGVLDYIQERGLVPSRSPSMKEACDERGRAFPDAFFDARERDLKKRLKPKRFEHARGVSKTAASLAETYGADVRKGGALGRPAARLGDKEYGDDEIHERASRAGRDVDPYVLDTMPRLLHGLTAAAELSARTPTCPPTWSRPSLGTRPRRWA